MYVKMSRWRSRERCIECHKVLRGSDYYYSSGVCPKCGHAAYPRSTICETFQEVYRVVKTRRFRWWPFGATTTIEIAEGHW